MFWANYVPKWGTKCLTSHWQGLALDVPDQELVRIWYDPVNAYPETGGLAGRWMLNLSDEMSV